MNTLFCRCCLTFEDNLYPFKQYETAFQDCTGLEVETYALICPGCIRKLNEAHEFREESLRSDKFLKERPVKPAEPFVVKTELVEDEEYTKFGDDFFGDDDGDEDNFDDGNCEVKVEEKMETSFVDVMIPAEEVRKKDRKHETPKAMMNSLKAKLAWTRDVKENLIKECPYCFLSGLRKMDLKKHIQEHVDANGGYECDHCNKKFKRKKLLKQHLNKVSVGLKRERAQTKELPCGECTETFKGVRLLRAHYKDKHPSIEIPGSGGPYACAQCGRMLSSKQSLEAHEFAHSGVRPYICRQCGKGYRDKCSLRKHEASHTGERPFMCSTCGRGFTTKKILHIHEFSHTGERPFPCSYCEKGFKTKRELELHEPNHTGELNFPCDVCGKRYKALTLLRTHMISHEALPRHACDICGLKFKYLPNLRAHVKMCHTDARDYKCGECNKFFKKKYALRTHLKLHMNKMGLSNENFEFRKINPSEGYKMEGFVIRG